MGELFPIVVCTFHAMFSEDIVSGYHCLITYTECPHLISERRARGEYHGRHREGKLQPVQAAGKTSPGFSNLIFQNTSVRRSCRFRRSRRLEQNPKILA